MDSNPFTLFNGILQKSLDPFKLLPAEWTVTKSRSKARLMRLVLGKEWEREWRDPGHARTHSPFFMKHLEIRRAYCALKAKGRRMWLSAM